MVMQSGGCLCGAVRYTTKADPLRVAICHCRFCQRSTGSAYLVEPFFEAKDFEVVTGEPAVYQHRSSGSGKLLHMHFCAKCGTKLFTLMERYPELVGVAAGTFDNPVWFEPAKVTRHVFTNYARPGTVIPPGVNTYEEAALTLDGQLNVAQVFVDFHVIGPIA